jgi:MFS superfamily sulfate permease-like transporter
MPVTGNLGDTILLEQAGARTPMAGIVTIGLVLLVLQFGASLPNLPLAAFAAIVIFAVLRPPDRRILRRIWRFDRAELWLGALCLLGVVFLGLMKGLLLAIAVTVLVLLARASRPHVREIGYVPGADPSFVDRAREPHAQELPDALMLQPIGALFFASARAITEEARTRFANRTSPPALVILDLRVVPWVDFTACEILASLEKHLRLHGARLLLVRANGYVERQLGRAGLLQSTGLPGDMRALLAFLHLPPDVRDRT